MVKKIKLIKANIAVDNRGDLIFSNECVYIRLYI